MKTVWEAYQKPYLVGGLQIDVASQCDEVDKNLTTKSPPAESAVSPRVLLIAVSNTCGFCSKNIGQWEKLISSLQWSNTNKEVWLIGFEKQGLVTDPLLSWLKQHEVPFRFLVPRDPHILSMFTGITAIPVTIVLNENRAINLMCEGELGARELEQFRSALNTDSTSNNVKFLRSSLSTRTLSLKVILSDH